MQPGLTSRWINTYRCFSRGSAEPHKPTYIAVEATSRSRLKQSHTRERPKKEKVLAGLVGKERKPRRFQSLETTN